MNKEELLEEYNGWVEWLNTQAGGTVDFENFKIEEQDFETTSELVGLIADRLYESSNIIEAINIFSDKIDKLLDKEKKNE